MLSLHLTPNGEGAVVLANFGGWVATQWWPGRGSCSGSGNSSDVCAGATGCMPVGLRAACPPHFTFTPPHPGPLVCPSLSTVHSPQQGWFNETLPGAPISSISFLRLDGDLCAPACSSACLPLLLLLQRLPARACCPRLCALYCAVLCMARLLHPCRLLPCSASPAVLPRGI